MNCIKCNSEIQSMDCSKVDKLMFYGICYHCHVLNRMDINLETNTIDVSMARDEELEKAQSLFSAKNKAKVDNLEDKAKTEIVLDTSSYVNTDSYFDTSSYFDTDSYVEDDDVFDLFYK